MPTNAASRPHFGRRRGSIISLVDKDQARSDKPGFLDLQFGTRRRDIRIVLFGGVMDGPSFLAYVEQILARTLHQGDIVFMDTLRTHKIVRYLPAYSPDFNPV